MPYQPTKEHLDHQIPDAFKSINILMRQLKQDIGMDDRYIALMLDALSREYSAKQPIRDCLLYTSPSPRDLSTSRMPSSA